LGKNNYGEIIVLKKLIQNGNKMRRVKQITFLKIMEIYSDLEKIKIIAKTSPEFYNHCHLMKEKSDTNSRDTFKAYLYLHTCIETKLYFPSSKRNNL